jgi:hypothetical protein
VRPRYLPRTEPRGVAIVGYRRSRFSRLVRFFINWFSWD